MNEIYVLINVYIFCCITVSNINDMAKIPAAELLHISRRLLFFYSTHGFPKNNNFIWKSLAIYSYNN